MIYLIAILLICLFWYVPALFKNVWKSKNVPHEKPLPFFGNYIETLIGRKAVWELLLETYNKYSNKRTFNNEFPVITISTVYSMEETKETMATARDEHKYVQFIIERTVDTGNRAIYYFRYFGFYQFLQPILVIRDPELIKQITVKDFDVFPEHGKLIADNFDQVWSNNLFAMSADRWKQMRPTLSPAFTSSKMRIMFELMQDCAENFCNYFVQEKELVKVELKDVFSKYTNDVIASTAFGLNCNTMEKQNNEFYTNGKRMTEIASIRFFLYRLSPYLQELLNIKIIDDKSRMFFSSVINDTLKVRREKGLVRKDMIHLLLQAQKGIEDEKEVAKDISFAATQEHTFDNNNEKPQKLPIRDIDIISQAMIFFFAGFDTVSTVMSLTGYELMMNPDIQRKLIEEVDAVFENCEGKITYEDVGGMKYLDMVISETLRKWPPFPLVDRRCTRNYTIKPERDDEQNLILEKDTILWIPIYALHRDPELYENPDKFDPERFSEENKHKINPYVFVPFGVGPRNCIGSRFALLENKIIWVNLLRHFEIVPTGDSSFNPKWDKKSFGFSLPDGFNMAFKRRSHVQIHSDK